MDKFKDILFDIRLNIERITASKYFKWFIFTTFIGIIIIIGFYVIFSKDIKGKVKDKDDNISVIENNNNNNIKANGQLQTKNNKNTTANNKTIKNNKNQNEKQDATKNKKNKLKIEQNELEIVKKQAENITLLPKKIQQQQLNNFIKKFNSLKKQNVVKIFGYKKLIETEKPHLCFFYGNACNNLILTSKKNIMNKYYDINSYVYDKQTKCIKVLNKKECSIKEYKYIKYKKFLIPLKVAKNIVNNKNTSLFYLLADDNNIVKIYLPFHSKYGWYYYKTLNLGKTAYENGNLKIIYFFNKYITDYKSVYNSNVLEKIKVAFNYIF